jgi:8-oxo-dGTP diphosphatase
MKHIDVVAAIIIVDNKILCVQRNVSKYDYISMKFEFPGGKVEQGESNEIALKREIKEELNIDIDIKQDFLIVNHEYPDFKLTMHSFICSSINTNLTLTEHIDFKWLTKDKITELDWAAADVPIVEKLKNA